MNREVGKVSILFREGVFLFAEIFGIGLLFSRVSALVITSDQHHLSEDTNGSECWLDLS